MLQSTLLIPTLREIPNDAEIKSHQLLIRAGYIRPVSEGNFFLLPLAERVMRKIKAIVEEEFQSINATEVSVPLIQPSEIWETTGRYDRYRRRNFVIKDKNTRKFLVASRNEEIYFNLLKTTLDSYRKLPISLYTIQKKFYDNLKAKNGLILSKEFLTADLNTFHSSMEDLDSSIRDVQRVFSEILKRCHVDFRVIQSEGVLNSALNKEFYAITNIGNTTICFSDESDYASKLEAATSDYTSKKSHESRKELEKIETPKIETIEDVSEFMGVSKKKIIKSLVYVADERLVLVLIRGDQVINEYKLQRYLHAGVLELASPEMVEEHFGAQLGSIGPIDIPDGIEMYADQYVQDMANVVAGANETGFHYCHVNPARDFEPNAYDDFRLVSEGDPSPDGEGKLLFAKGLELGRIIRSGDYFAEKTGTKVLDQSSTEVPIQLGSHSIGMTRLFQTIVELHSDENGIKWPFDIAPFHVHLIPIDYEEEEQEQLTQEILMELTDVGYEVLVNDRVERAGVKFADADLIGIPVQVIIGKKASEGIIEVKINSSGESIEVKKEELLNTITVLIQSNLEEAEEVEEE